MGGSGTLKGSEEELEKHAESVRSYIMKRAEDYKSDAKELLLEYELLGKRAREVRSMLEEMLRIAILPGECKYLKYAW